MKLKALTSFAGKITMYAGEVREVLDEAIAKDLLRAGYAEEVGVSKKETTTETPVEKPAKNSTRKKKK